MEDIPEPRQRKKKLINAVKELLEFYFSPANISKDKFMKNLLNDSPYIDIEIFHKFNKIKALTMETKILQKAVQKSDILELSEDGLKVKRSFPVELKENETECTIYVENLPPNSSHEWLHKVFSLYGVIDYISLPKFPQSGRPKGFAFIEFNSPQEAKKALEAFGGLASLDGTLNPSDLLTIRTYKEVGNPNEDENSHLQKNVDDGDNKGKASVSTVSDIRKDDEKRSFKDAFGKNDSDSEPDSKHLKLSPDSIKESFKKKKKKRRRNKREKEYELDSVYLRVMSKGDWKALRNKYLNTQKEIMKQLKQSIQYMNESKYKEKPLEKKEGESKRRNKPSYIPDVIVKITLNKPPQDPKEFREGVTNGRSTIQYVDVNSKNKVIYLRFRSSDDAKLFVKEGLWDNVELLKGEEELAYWTKLITSWELKRPCKKHKKNINTSVDCRGRDKLINRALKLKTNESSHIVFDE